MSGAVFAFVTATRRRLVACWADAGFVVRHDYFCGMVPPVTWLSFAASPSAAISAISAMMDHLSGCVGDSRMGALWGLRCPRPRDHIWTPQRQATTRSERSEATA